MTHPHDILGIEERALNAWPALQILHVNGWALRLSGGFTKRANSANALAPQGYFATVKAATEMVYARAGLPAVFRISPLAPPEADALLAAAGYTHFDPSSVMTAPLGPSAIAPEIRVTDTPDAAWRDGFARANGVSGAMRQSHDAILAALALPAAFVSYYEGTTPVGFGLGVYERGYVGLFDIVTLPAARGRGVGRAITQAILGWGQAQGATHAYLCVRDVNAVAITLYESLGFTRLYGYHYRLPPSP